MAIRSSRGADAFEERSFAAAEIEAPGRPVAAAVGPGGVDVAALAAAARAGFHEGSPQAAEPGEWAVVLGPVAVAQVLELLKPELTAPDGLVAARRGARIVSPAVNLADSPRFPGTLPRSYDAEGVPRRPVPLIQDGVAHQVVADAASGVVDGPRDPPRARRAVARPPRPTGGGAASVDELVAPLELALFVPAFLPFGRDWLLDGARLIEAGERTWPVNGAAELDPVGVLAGTEALTGAQQLVPTDDDSALTIGATLAPALRTRAGVVLV